MQSHRVVLIMWFHVWNCMKASRLQIRYCFASVSIQVLIINGKKPQDLRKNCWQYLTQNLDDLRHQSIFPRSTPLNETTVESRVDQRCFQFEGLSTDNYYCITLMHYPLMSFKESSKYL